MQKVNQPIINYNQTRKPNQTTQPTTPTNHPDQTQPTQTTTNSNQTNQTKTTNQTKAKQTKNLSSCHPQSDHLKRKNLHLKLFEDEGQFPPHELHHHDLLSGKADGRKESAAEKWLGDRKAKKQKKPGNEVSIGSKYAH